MNTRRILVNGLLLLCLIAAIGWEGYSSTLIQKELISLAERNTLFQQRIAETRAVNNQADADKLTLLYLANLDSKLAISRNLHLHSSKAERTILMFSIVVSITLVWRSVQDRTRGLAGLGSDKPRQ